MECTCEAVGCDGSCKGPYVWWFGIKFVVTKELNEAIREYYTHFIPSRKAASMTFKDHGQ
jgi:hypothetical protein